MASRGADAKCVKTRAIIHRTSVSCSIAERTSLFRHPFLQ
jgi:hypothetical protein